MNLNTKEQAADSFLNRLKRLISGKSGDRQQLRKMLRDAQKRDLFDIDALAMIEGVLAVSEMQVRDIMIPRAQMVMVSHDATLEAMLPVITESAHSRFPVMGDNQDEVVGILLAKDLLTYFIQGHDEKSFSVRDILRPVVFIPVSKRLNVLLKDFRASRNHMAIVVNEYGGVDGLVTIEDVLEQIVGDITDEHDVEENIYILKHSDTNYTIKALTPIDEFNEVFSTSFSDEEFDTIGGLVMRAFGHLPRRGEIKEIADQEGLPENLRLRFKVLHSDSRRVHLLQMTLLRGHGPGTPAADH